MAQQCVNSAVGISNALLTFAGHMRMAVEGTHVRDLAEGHEFSPSFSTGMRRGDRDGLSAYGYELGSSVRYEALQGISVDASGQAVMSGSNRIHQWEMRGSMDYDAGSDKLGVLGSLQPAWGGTGQGEQQFLWGRDILDVSDSSGIGSNGARIESEIGYGFTLADGSWTSTPYGSASLNEENSNVFRIGNRFRTGSDISFEIEGSETVGTRGRVSRDIKLTGEIRW